MHGGSSAKHSNGTGQSSDLSMVRTKLHKEEPNRKSMGHFFWDTEKAFDKTWYLGLLYKLSELKFSISLIKLISSFLSQRKFRVLVKGELSTPRDIQAGVSQGSVLSPTL
jgi:hypothetical protein